MATTPEQETAMYDQPDEPELVNVPADELTFEHMNAYAQVTGHGDLNQFREYRTAGGPVPETTRVGKLVGWCYRPGENWVCLWLQYGAITEPVYVLDGTLVTFAEVAA